MLPDSAQRPVVIDLSREASFRLGAVDVSPSSLELRRGEQCVSLEPRTMQVLVVLARADGGVVSRSELVERCWNGRIVGDNAINRTLSHIRKLAAGVGQGCFTLETITTIGYRLVDTAAEASPPATQAASSFDAGAAEAAISQPCPDTAATAAPSAQAPAGCDRRWLLGTAALAGVAGLAWWRRDPPAHEPSAAARTLYDKGTEALVQARLEQGLQAVAYFREAVRIDSEYADAWGALALCYATQIEHSDKPAELAALAIRSKSAAARALALDPGNMDAEVARVVLKPPFRNWVRLERDAGALLVRHPDHRRLNGMIGRILCDVGRWAEAVAQFSRLVERQLYLPVMHGQFANALWGAGRLDEAETAIARAVALWPGHPALGMAPLGFLALTGRPDAALAQLGTAFARQDDPDRARLAGIYSALQSAKPADADREVANLLGAVRAGRVSTVFAFPFLLALGETDSVFPLLDAYYFGSRDGPAGVRAAPGPWSRRETDMLFMPSAARLWRDRRFLALTRRLGLEDYWRITGTLADHRRNAA